MKVAMEQATEHSAEESWEGAAAPGVEPTWCEERAFRALYDRHLRDVLHFLRFQVRDVDRPDVASRVFEIAARDLAKFVVPPGKKREQAERKRLHIIARNASESHRQQTHQAEQLDDDALRAPEDLERDTAAFDLAVKLLWMLPERQRTLYLLHERDGLTHEDIAQDMGMPLGTVKTQLRAAQAELDAAIDRLCARERTRRADYLRTQKALEQVHEQYKAAKSEQYGSLSLSGDYGFLNMELFDGDDQVGWSAGLGYSVPVFDGGRIKTNQRQLMSQIRSQEYRLRQVELLISSEMRLAHQDARSRFAQVGVAEKSLQLSEEELQLAQRRFLARAEVDAIATKKSANLLEFRTQQHLNISKFPFLKTLRPFVKGHRTCSQRLDINDIRPTLCINIIERTLRT